MSFLVPSTTPPAAVHLVVAPEPGAGGYAIEWDPGFASSDFFYGGAPARPFSIPPYATNLSVGKEFDSTFGFVGPLAAGIFLPPVDIFSQADIFGPAIEETTSTVGSDPVYEEGPPEFPPGFPNFPRAPTDWERVYDEYVILNPTTEGQMNGVIDWGDVLTTGIGAIGNILGPSPQAQQLVAGPAAVTGPAPVTAYVPAGGVVATGGGCCPSPGNGQPRYLRYCTSTGTYSTIKRKRRKDLLTNGDFNNLMRIASLPNKETVKIALAAAIR